MKIKLIIDKVGYSTKPQGFEVGKIINRMTIQTAKEYSIEEIKQSILDGKTIRPSNCDGKEDTWKSQQVFLIDIDNEGNLTDDIVLNDYVKLVESKKTKVRFLVGSKQHKSYDDIIEHCKNINLIPNFIYTSFNHKEEQHKYRLVFVLDKEITDNITAKKIQLYLMSSIGEVDEQCKNINRIYYAGKTIPFDSGNVLNTDKIIEDSEDIELKSSIKINKIKNPSIQSSNTQKEKKPQDNIDINNIYNIPLLSCGEKPLTKINIPSSTQSKVGRKGSLDTNGIINITIISSDPKTPSKESDGEENKYNIKSIANRDITFLKEKYGSGDKKIFETNQQFIDYIRTKIDLGELLEFHYPKSIRCIFHDDNNNSASIFQNDEGAWFYKCFGCNISYNIVGVIERLAKFKIRQDTYKFIREIFNLEMMDTEWQKQQKEILLDNIRTLNDGEFAGNCDQADKNINRSKHYLEKLMLIAMDNVYNENLIDKDGNVVFFSSASYICKQMGMNPNSIKLVYQKLALFSYHKMLNKLNDSEIPAKFLKKSMEFCDVKGQDKYNHINWFSIPSLTVFQFPKIEQRGKKWKENHYTMKGISREMFFRAEGLKIANEVYPQYKKVIENVEGTYKLVDRTTTKKSDIRTNNIVKAIYELIEEYGYATEKEIVQKLKFKYQYITTEIQIKKSLKEILDAYGLKRIRANKVVKEQYGMGGDGYPFIIYKGE